MSVTNLNEIDKADVLVAGLRKHLKEAQELGITIDALDRLEEAAKAMRQKDAEVDENAQKRKEGRFMPDIAQRNSAQQDGAYCKGSVVCNGIQQKHTKAKVKCSDRI